MMIRRLLVILLAVTACSRLVGFGETDTVGDVVQSNAAICDGDSAHSTDIVAFCDMRCVGIAAVSYAGVDAAPVSVRTLLHNTRPVLRHASYGFMSRAIDSPLKAGRYGLYNHKILFASRSADHYLHKMCRLVI